MSAREGLKQTINFERKFVAMKQKQSLVRKMKSFGSVGITFLCTALILGSCANTAGEAISKELSAEKYRLKDALRDRVVRGGSAKFISIAAPPITLDQYIEKLRRNIRALTERRVQVEARREAGDDTTELLKSAGD
jgi:hypothetical protein